MNTLKVSDAREIGQRVNKPQVIIITIDEEGTVESISYGATKNHRAAAKELAEIANDKVQKYLNDRWLWWV